MRIALAEARKAASRGEIPIGAVVVDPGGSIIGRGFNARETTSDPTGHAEMIALREAGRERGDWRLDECDLYVTLEPCPMCAGAVVNARIARVVYGISDPKAGAVGTLYDIPRDPRLNHRAEVVAGVLADESRELLQTFFRRLRSG